MGSLKCRMCGRRYRYPRRKYIDEQPNRMIATRRHYKKYHPSTFETWKQKRKTTLRKKKHGKR